MKIISCYIFLLFLGINSFNSKIRVSINHNLPVYESTIRIIQGDHIKLETDAQGKWYNIKPVLKEYDNLSSKKQNILKIDYEVSEVQNKSESKILNLSNLSPGTYYYGRFKNSKSKIKSNKPIHFESESIIQIIVRRDNSYTGILTELLNLPFIIPPKTIPDYGHQTDLAIGSDCAELAIYGRRQLGHKIPYCGPRNIYKYVEESDNIKPGTILHFGFQVSVLYKDKGVIGKIDEKDLLIHAFENKVEITPFGKTSLIQSPFKLYNWKL
ncbi:hypothetical protein [uncultured Tenacibaculum sp.]|uniref:hypothetical protein n=1 Tax=uncultured Tenacibaculum sp. TaxID=174713 RepID=UPI00261C13FC|nr:hypothetical protein [uncultured Tenacibaculum sp.]